MALSYFSEFNAGTYSLWVTDGTIAGPPVKAFVGNPIGQLTMIGGRVYFVVDDGVHGQELWTSDGTAAGTVLVRDIDPGAASSNPIGLTDLNGTLFFAADDGTHGVEPWLSNGTAAGTTLFKDINPGGGSIGLTSPVNVNGTVFFAATDGTNGNELWKSDGTVAGTVMVKDINPGAGPSDPGSLANVNGTLFFSAFDPVNGDELWKSDGTAAGTVMVKDINPAGSSGPINLTNVNGTLFFTAFDLVNGTELWKSDGTAAGTVLVKDIFPGAVGSSPQGLTNVNGRLFFAANDGTKGYELWRSDGTAAGTVMVKDIDPGAVGSNPTGLTNINGTLFFSADDGTNGSELWKSDGTAAGTVIVKDLTSAPGGSSPQGLTNVNGMLEFYAFDGMTEGLFRSDGTAAGTVELATNVSVLTPIGFTPQSVVNDLNGDRMSDILWRNSNGTLADWSMNGGVITSGAFLTSGGSPITQDATWSVAGISDFNGDGNADVLWRNTHGMVADWSMNGSTVTSNLLTTFAGVPVTPDASWSVAGVGDFDGDSRSDILWRNSDGTLATWFMNGANIQSSGTPNVGGVAIKPDASWSVAGIGDFNADNKRDIVWRNTSSGETTIWLMNGASITWGADVTFGGSAVKPDASWSVAGIGDFNHDGNSDLLWRSTNGTLNVWFMFTSGSIILSSQAITFNGSAVTPDATWHVVEIGDFNGDSNSDILWRNDNGSMAEWLMNGSTITQSVTPTTGALPISPDASWSTQAKPTNFG